MLGQAAAMLIPFPATVAAEVGRVALPIRLDLGAFAGSAIPALGDSLAVLGVAGRGLASDRWFLARAVHTLGEIRAESCSVSH